MLHTKRSSQRRVRFDNDVVLLAEVGDVGSGIERMDLPVDDPKSVFLSFGKKKLARKHRRGA